ILTRARRLGLTPMQMSLEESGAALRLRPVNVEDLLLRPSAKIDYERLEAFVRGKSAVVTGGGGSIGAEICDRLATYGIGRLMVIENSEPALHAVLEALAAKDSRATIDGRIADIRDRERVIARAALGARLGRGHQDQRVRLDQRRRCGGRRRCRGD